MWKIRLNDAKVPYKKTDKYLTLHMDFELTQKAYIIAKIQKVGT